MHLILIAVAGAVFAFGFPPIGIALAHYGGMAACAYILFRYKRTRRERMLLAWVFGFASHLIGLFWVSNAIGYVASSWIAGFGAVVIGSAYLAIFFAVPAYLASMAKALPARLATFYALLLIADWIRSYYVLPFPWNNFGHGWFFSEALLQSASILGVYGMGAVSLGTSLAIAYVLLRRKESQRFTRWQPLAAFAACTCLLWSYGAVRLAASVGNTHEVVAPSDWSIRIVQPNIDQQEKWQGANARPHLDRQIALTTEGLSPSGNILVVWPEAATNFIGDNFVAASSIIREAVPAHAAIALGHLRWDEAGLRNSLSVILPKSELARISPDDPTRPAEVAFSLPYDKANLVPFGEYTPLGSLLGISALATGNEIIPGTSKEPLYLLGSGTTPPLALASVICYDAVFSGRVASTEVDMIVNVTNDAWYGDSWGPPQHAAYSRLRTIEEGVPMARSANTGISGVWNAFGQPIALLPFSTRTDAGEVLDVAMPARLQTTFFAAFGYLPFGLWIIIAGFGAVVLHAQAKQRAALKNKGAVLPRL